MAKENKDNKVNITVTYYPSLLFEAKVGRPPLQQSLKTGLTNVQTYKFTVPVTAIKGFIVQAPVGLNRR